MTLVCDEDFFFDDVDCDGDGGDENEDDVTFGVSGGVYRVEATTDDESSLAYFRAFSPT